MAVGSEMDRMEQRFGPEAARRFSDAYRHFEHTHHQCMTDPHWYLALLGVSPGCQGRGIGRALLTPVLRRADQEGLPCYLETFVSANVPFYEHRGFQVVEAGVEPLSQIAFWAMKREPLG
jgi:GNAT superfamily N-acetyltransferase